MVRNYIYLPSILHIYNQTHLYLKDYIFIIKLNSSQNFIHKITRHTLNIVSSSRQITSNPLAPIEPTISYFNKNYQTDSSAIGACRVHKWIRVYYPPCTKDCRRLGYEETKCCVDQKGAPDGAGRRTRRKDGGKFTTLMQFSIRALMAYGFRGWWDGAGGWRRVDETPAYIYGRLCERKVMLAWPK